MHAIAKRSRSVQIPVSGKLSFIMTYEASGTLVFHQTELSVLPFIKTLHSFA
jgi:hypothetical protein